MVKIDVFVPEAEEFARVSYERETIDTLTDEEHAREFSMATPEDMIVHKLAWFELGDGVATRQWDDVLGVIRVQGEELDWVYVERWAGELGIAPLLERARAEAMETE